MAVSTKEFHRQRRKARVRSRVHGTKNCPRLSVFRSNQSIEAQLIDDDAGKTLAGVTTRTEKAGANMEAAKKLGAAIGKKAAELKIKTCVFDRNGYKYHGRVKAVAEAARESGLSF